LAILLALASPARADDDGPADQAEPTDEPVRTEATSSSVGGGGPPAIDYPGLIRTGGVSLYVDHTYETVNDLSTFWWVRGRGSNYRLAVGGSYRSGDLCLSAEIPVQYTYLQIDSLMGLLPTEADRNKAAISLGDLLTSAAYDWRQDLGGIPVLVGLGLRVRWPTHTTRYRFGLMDGSILEFGFPYYLHLAPTLIASARFGPVSLTVNQGVLAMLAKDVTIGDILQRIPNIYFWESHVALDLAIADWLDLSTELVSMVQLNRVEVDNMSNLNGTRAMFITPGATLELQGVLLSVAARFGLAGRSSRDFGVITFSGERAYLVRLAYRF
jgi:hypothetical protein